MKALVAVEHAMLVTAWTLLSNREFYRDPGADYFTRHDPQRPRARAAIPTSPGSTVTKLLATYILASEHRQ